MGPEKIKWDAISVRPSRKSGTMRNALPEDDSKIVYDLPKPWAKCLLDDINQVVIKLIEKTVIGKKFGSSSCYAYGGCGDRYPVYADGNRYIYKIESY